MQNVLRVEDGKYLGGNVGDVEERLEAVESDVEQITSDLSELIKYYDLEISSSTMATLTESANAAPFKYFGTIPLPIDADFSVSDIISTTDISTDTRLAISVGLRISDNRIQLYSNTNSLAKKIRIWYKGN